MSVHVCAIICSSVFGLVLLLPLLPFLVVIWEVLVDWCVLNPVEDLANHADLDDHGEDSVADVEWKPDPWLPGGPALLSFSSAVFVNFDQEVDDCDPVAGKWSEE